MSHYYFIRLLAGTYENFERQIIPIAATSNKTDASSNETSELLEEGIEINSIPWVDKTNS